MTEPADNLSPKQHKAIAALMSSPTISAAAAAVGVNERQVYRWLDDPAFAEAYRAARREAVGQATARLQQVSSEAVDRLQALLTCGKPAIELSAARSIIEFAVKSVELEDLQARIEALEAKYGT
jgi:hypothetical protein